MSRSRHVRGKGKYREKRWLKYVGLGTESNRWSKRRAARKVRREAKRELLPPGWNRLPDE